MLKHPYGFIVLRKKRLTD